MSRSCYHCGLDALDQISACIDGEQKVFCCVGCKAVAQTIHASGLAQFYDYREVKNDKASETQRDYSAFDFAQVQSDFIFDAHSTLKFDPSNHQIAPEKNATLKEARLYLPDVRCAACVWLIEHHLQSLEGIFTVRVNASTQTASVIFEGSAIKVSEIFCALADIGYPPEPLVAHSQQDQIEVQHRQDLLKLGVAGIGMMQAGMVSVALHAGSIQGMEPVWQHLLRWVTLGFTLPVLFYSAQPFFISALKALKIRRLNMDVPVALALVLAFSASTWATVMKTGDVYFDSVAMFTFFLLLGRYLEKRTRLLNVRSRIKQAQTIPLTAERVESGITTSIPLKLLQQEDTVWVPPGATIPCDAVIIDGTSDVDESLLTGESKPIVKSVGDKIIAGSANGQTGLTARVTATGEATEFAAIERLVDGAELSGAAQVRFADVMASKFVAAVLVTAVVVGATWLWVDASKALWVVLSVLVVTCPCALSLATPAALTAAVNRLRKMGVLVSGANALETLSKVDCVIFDKTGTLTHGQYQVVNVITLGVKTPDQVLDIAAALEYGSAHPIARAFASRQIVHQVSERKVSLGEGLEGNIENDHYRLGRPDFASPGLSMSYPGPGLWLLMSNNEAPLAWIELADALRPDAKTVVHQLKQRTMALSILSGDRLSNVLALANTLNIDSAEYELMPNQKLEAIQRMQNQGKVVLMVGDGINDVPVLVAADVSVAMGSATEFAQNKADCVLLGDHLSALPQLLSMAQSTRMVIKQNSYWAVGYNLTALPAAAFGLIPPWAAAIGMSLSSLIVVLNALRLGRYRDNSVR